MVWLPDSHGSISFEAHLYVNLPLFRDEQHYVCSENTLVGDDIFTACFTSQVIPTAKCRCKIIHIKIENRTIRHVSYYEKREPSCSKVIL